MNVLVLPNALAGRRQQFSTEETKRLIQQQLVLLLHAHRCEEMGVENCTVQWCPMLKNVLIHQRACQHVNSCEVRHCVSSRKILRHWRTCMNGVCEICVSIRKTPKEWHGTMTEVERLQLLSLILHTGMPHPSTIESYIYYSANTREEYYRRVAAKMWQERNRERQPQQDPSLFF